MHSEGLSRYLNSTDRQTDRQTDSTSLTVNEVKEFNREFKGCALIFEGAPFFMATELTEGHGNFKGNAGSPQANHETRFDRLTASGPLFHGGF